MTALLDVRGLTKKFGGVVALDHLDLVIPSRSIVGLIGPNGSGKTTFFNVVTRLYTIDAGLITFEGVEISNSTPRAVYRAGICRTFQRSRLSLPLSIFDNIMIGNQKRLNHGLWFNLVRRSAFRRQFEAAYGEARDLLALFEPRLVSQIFQPLISLPMIDRRRVEICRALISRPKLLLLDEPSAGMTPEETTLLMDDILQVRAQAQDLTIVIIEHQMGVIERITDQCVVLNFGRKIAEGPYRCIAADQQVQAAYLGPLGE